MSSTPRPGGFGPLLLRLHFYAGLFVAPFLLVAALTGLAYTVTPQLERVVYADELVAEPGGAVRPLAEQIAAAQAAHPGGAVTAVRPGGDDRTTQVDFSSAELDEEHQHTVYVDPYTARVKGQLTTWWATTPLTTWFDDLHRNLHLGTAGRYYSELAASWLWVLALGGVVLWWRRQRGRRMLRPDLSAKKGVRRTRGWHAATGLWITVGLLVLSATGLTWSRFAGANFSAALDAMHGHTPELSTTIASGAAAGGHHGTGGTGGAAAVLDPATADRVLQVARANGLGGPVELTVPGDAGTAWSVAQIDDSLPVHRDRIAVDAASGTVVDRSDFADWPLLAKLTRYGINAHMGKLFGVANQALLALLAIGLTCVIVWGYRMWWQRRPTRADRRAPVGSAPAARGAWQQLPAWAVAAGVPVVFGVAWAMPLLGVPLAAFLLVDVAVGRFTARTRGIRTP